MKRIENTEVWTDGKINYRKNDRGEFEIYVEEPANIVEPEEAVVLKPVDNTEKE